MIGIISDTHDNVKDIHKAMRLFEENRCELVLHLGDIVTPQTIQYFKDIPTKFVKGNCDNDIDMIKEKVKEIKGSHLGTSGSLEIKGKVLFLIHGDDFVALTKAIQSNKFDYVFHGHTHEVRDELIGKTRVINPGALHMMTETKTVAILDIEKNSLTFQKIV